MAPEADTDEHSQPTTTDTPTPMFKIIAERSTLESLINPADQLVDECKLRFDEDGVSIHAVDPANVAMTFSTLDVNACESYQCAEGILGINLDRLTDFIGMAGKGDLILLELDEETRKLQITVEGLEFTLALIDPDSIRQEPDIPDLDLPATVVLEGRDVSRAVKAADMVGDHIALGFDLETAAFYAEAEGETDDVRLTIEGPDIIDGSADDDAHSLFSLDYLKDMNRAIDAGTEVTIEIGEDHPTKLHFETADGHGSVVYMLAPRVAK